MLAAPAMSASPLIDSYDAQMLDFAHDLDVAMNTASSTDFFAETLMDQDGHASTSIYQEHASVEVDMEECAGDNAEYDMVDETIEYHHHGDEPLDVEVYDVSHAPSPLVPPQPLQQPADVSIESEHPVLTSPTVSERPAHPHLPGEPEPPSGLSHVEPLASGSVMPSVSDSEAVTSDLPTSAEAPHENVPPTGEFHEETGDGTDPNGYTFEVPAPADTHDETKSHIQASAEEHHAEPSSAEVTERENPEPSVIESAALSGAEEVHDGAPPALEENADAVAQSQVTEGETVDPLQISEGVYIDPPPAVLLSITASLEPEYSLFNHPEVELGFEGTSAEIPESEPKVYSLLLESRPTLYYEPLSSVFEALRQDVELLARVPYCYEGELVLDAYDLQLVLSEDNVHSREISLHDLNVLHDGSDFSGPLRLHLRTSVPRFIVRYYALQEQVQRLNLTIETGESEHYDEEHIRHNESEHQPQHEQGEEFGHVPTEIPNIDDSEPLEVSLYAGAGESSHEPVLPPVLADEEAALEETEKSSAVSEAAAEYHEVTGEAAHALEDEDDYEGTNVGDEDESVKSERLDADQVHALAAADTDVAATVTGQESEYGGEQTDYLDYVQPEEYDDRYGDDLPEQAGGAPEHGYGETLQYEEGEQDTVNGRSDQDQDQDQDQEEGVTSTPIPAPAILEPESDDHVPSDSSGEPPSDLLIPGPIPIPQSPPTAASKLTVEQNNSFTKSAKLTTGESFK
ncbi:hypothetical protein BU15DRAFT_78686 [Melanogaster broomeanus]|nr:hypothetical protein BU15DRAFT_78686 [Melanogaster broomeanus]